MRAEKAGRGQQPSTSLRTSEKSTTRPSGLSDSAKLMGTLEHRPDSAEEGVDLTMQVPGDGTADSLSVRPATKHAVQVFGSLSRVGKKLRDSQEAQANKRTQSQAGIDQEDGDTRGTPKRLRTSDTATSRGKSHGNPHVGPEVNPGDEPAPPSVSQPVAPPVAQAAVKPPVKPAARATVQQASQPAAQPVTRPVIPPAVQHAAQHAVQPAPRPSPQAAPRVMPVPLAPSFDMTPEITPDMHAQIAMAEALRMANSILPYQPEKISELFQHLCRAQLWPLLKIEEQRAIYLMNLQRMMPVTYVANSIPNAGMAMAVDVPPSSTTTTTTTTPTPTRIPTAQPVEPTPIPVAETASTPNNAAVRTAPLPTPDAATRTPAPTAQVAQSAQTDMGKNASKINESLLPDTPRPPSPNHAKGLLGALSEETKLWMRKPADEITKMIGWQKLDLTSTTNTTAFICFLVEIAAHGGFPHLDGEIEGIVKTYLQWLLTSHRHRENENKVRGKGDAESRKVRIGRDPAYGHLLKLLPKYPQFTRALGLGINNLRTTHRTHLGISRRFNAVLMLIQERRFLTNAQFEHRLAEIADDASSPESSPTATSESTTTRTTTRTTTSSTASTPTSARTIHLEGGEDEGGDGEI